MVTMSNDRAVRTPSRKQRSKRVLNVVLSMICVILTVVVGVLIYAVVNDYQAQQLHHDVSGDPSALLVSKPVPNCRTVGQLGVHAADIPTGGAFAYQTQAMGGFCVAVLYTQGKDVKIVSSRPVAWAALYDVQANGQHLSNGLAFSYGDSLVADNQFAAAPNGLSYHAVPSALYVFSLPTTDPVSLSDAEAALPQTFGTTQGVYYPMIQVAGQYGLDHYPSILDAMMRNASMK